jgi:ATP-dependent RNA helicase DDX49/DBP8
MGKRARIPSPTASSQESDSSQESNKWHSDYQDEGHESSPRKRRRSSASSSEEEKVASQPTISTASLSRIKAKKPELLQPTAEKQESVSAVLTAQEKTDFSDLGVAPWLVASLAAMQIKRPTGIQKACIPEIIKGRDCIGGSRTGSGKTVAFMTPILQKWSEDPVGIFAVILTPTRLVAF